MVIRLAVRAGGQELRTTIGTTSPACFFACLTAFFSFGDSNDCFLVSLFDFWALDMRLAPLEGDHNEIALRV
jgi:hypothetical protein